MNRSSSSETALPGLAAEGLIVPLRQEFSYVHEPLIVDEGGVPFVGPLESVEAIRQRILHSRGGAFLVSGFRGVGKTSTVLRALRLVEDTPTEDAEYVSVYVPVPRPIANQVLLHQVLRRLVEALDDRRILRRLPPRIRQALAIAYARTSYSINETKSEGESSSAGLDAGGDALRDFLGGLVPKLEVRGTRERKRATELSFLTYSDRDAEHDLRRIAGLLSRIRENHRQPWLSGLLGRKAPKSIRLVVVFDELDKLTGSPRGARSLEKLLSETKSLLSAQGIHFIFVGGIDLYDRWIEQRSTANSLLESVFAWHEYLPCNWGAAVGILSRMTLGSGAHVERMGTLEGATSFRGRGLPSLGLKYLQSLVKWSSGRPSIVLSPEELRRAEVEAEIERLTTRFAGDATTRGLASDLAGRDRRKLVLRYVADWILETQGEVFTVDALMGRLTSAGRAAFRGVTKGHVEAFCRCLAEHQVLLDIREEESARTLVGSATKPDQGAFRLSERILLALNDSSHVEGEVVISGPTEPHSGTGAFLRPAKPLVGRAIGDRYRIERPIAAGGTGTVYFGIDLILKDRVAIKLLREELALDPKMRARFMREAQIGARLKHPGVVQVRNLISEGPVVGIVMSLVDGITLRERLMQGSLDEAETVRLGVQVADVLAYLHDQGIARMDIKPSNIMLTEAKRAVLVDLGLARFLADDAETITDSGVFVGTLAYAAPELILGAAHGPSRDRIGDIYSLGAVLFECLAGRRTREGDSYDGIMRGVMEPIEVEGIPASPRMRSVLSRCLAPRPEERFQSASELAEALRQLDGASRS